MNYKLITTFLAITSILVITSCSIDAMSGDDNQITTIQEVNEELVKKNTELITSLKIAEETNEELNKETTKMVESQKAMRDRNEELILENTELLSEVEIYKEENYLMNIKVKELDYSISELKTSNNQLKKGLAGAKYNKDFSEVIVEYDVESMEVGDTLNPFTLKSMSVDEYGYDIQIDGYFILEGVIEYSVSNELEFYPNENSANIYYKYKLYLDDKVEYVLSNKYLLVDEESVNSILKVKGFKQLSKQGDNIEVLGVFKDLNTSVTYEKERSIRSSLVSILEVRK